MKRVCLEEGSAKVLIWDIMTPTERTYELSLSGTRGVLLVYDVSAPVSYDETQRWLVWCHERMQTLCPVAIVGNKVDLVGTTMNRVPTKMGQEYARRVSEAMNIPTLFKETSAKTGENIDILFREFTRMILSYDEGRILDNK
jgi:GTPase SAR1 family protein